MRFMMFMIPPEYQPNASPEQKAGADFAPPKEAIEPMMKYNEQMAKVGILISLETEHLSLAQYISGGARLLAQAGWYCSSPHNTCAPQPHPFGIMLV